jgi:hypothetical protein
MGHRRLGPIPTTKKWAAVVDEVVNGAGLARDDVGRIAALTLAAAAPALENGKADPGLRHTFYLLAQIVLAARQADWRGQLAAAGISVSSSASLFDLTLSLHSAVDDHVGRYGQPSDISEIAQQAAGEALASLVGGRDVTLFGSGGEHLQRAVRELSTKAGFCRLGQLFFGRFLSRFLNFYLSRVTAAQVGGSRLPDIDAISDFNGTLQRHCEQSALIVRDFCGQWYSKTEYMEGIDPHNTSRFMAMAMRKLSRELAKQRAGA